MPRRNPVGLYRTPFVVQSFTTTRDALGQETKSWLTVSPTLWGLKRALSGREATNALQTKAVVSFVVETVHPRSLVTITPAMALLIDNHRYGIEWTNDPDDRHETLLIYCKESVVPA